MRDHWDKWEARLALRLLGLPGDTAGVCTPGTITFPAGTHGIRIEGFQLILTRDVPPIAVEPEKGVLRFMGGAK